MKGRERQYSNSWPIIGYISQRSISLADSKWAALVRHGRVAGDEKSLEKYDKEQLLRKEWHGMIIKRMIEDDNA